VGEHDRALGRQGLAEQNSIDAGGRLIASLEALDPLGQRLRTPAERCAWE
jgi:hypothetical protein